MKQFTQEGQVPSIAHKDSKKEQQSIHYLKGGNSSSSSERKNRSQSQQRERERFRSREKQGSSRTKKYESTGQNNERFRGSRAKPRINHFALTNIIKEQKRTNRRLDQEETSNAASNYELKFKEKITPVVLSEYLSSEGAKRPFTSKDEDRKQLLQFRLKCAMEGCSDRFETAEELQSHIQRHKQEILK